MAVLAFQRRRQPVPAASADDLHTTLVRWIEDSENFFQAANTRASRDRDYYDGRQWSDQDAKDRLDLGRAVICVNRISRKIRFMKGYEATNRTSAKALPRTPAHEQAADVITEGLRYVADIARIDQKFSDAYEYLLIEGIEIVEVTAKTSADGSVDPAVNLIPWDRFVYDPYSREKDFNDARYLGISSWFDLDQAIAKWPEQEEMLRAALNDAPNHDIYEDRPKWSVSLISDRPRLRLVQLYFRQDGVWMHAIFCRSGFIEPPAPSLFVDEYGTPECPILAGCALLNQDNERYGIVREMIDLQDEINVRHSNDIDFSKMRQTVGEKGAVADVNESKRELQKPNGHVEITRGLRFEVLPTNDLAANNLQALELARSEIEMVGPNAALLGKDTRAPSGRAILASQEGGLHELSPFLDCHTDFKERTYRAIWHRIKQFWQSEKWIRVTDDQDKPKFIGLNVPVTYGQLLAQQNGGQIPPEAQLRYGPMLQQPVTTANQISYLDMDIVISEVAHSAVVQQEQFDNLVEMAKLAGTSGQAIPFEALIEASALRDKDKILKRLEESKQQSGQQQAMQAEALAKKLASEIENNLASARQKDADALAKTIAAQIQGLQAQTYALLTPPVQPPPAMSMINASYPGQPAPPAPIGGPSGAALAGPDLPPPGGSIPVGPMGVPMDTVPPEQSLPPGLNPGP